MKKLVLLITVLTTIFTAVFTGCGTKSNTNGDSVTDNSSVTRNTENDNNGSGFEYIPRELDGRAVDKDKDEKLDDDIKPRYPKKHRHRRLGDGTLFIIRFEKVIRDDGTFNPHRPLEPIMPEKDPEEITEEDTDNGEN